MKVFQLIVVYLGVLCLWVITVVLPVIDWLNGQVDNQLVQNIYKLLVFLGLVVLPFSLLITWVLNRTVLKALNDITELTRVLATGNLSQRPKVLPGKPLYELSENINKIIDNLLSSLKSMISSLQSYRQKEIELAKNLTELNLARRQGQSVLNQLYQEKEKLQQLSSKDEAILTSIADAVVAVDKDGRIFLANRVALQMTGFSKSEFLGLFHKSGLKFINFKTNQEIELINRVFSRDIGFLEGKIILINRYGRKIPVAVSAAPIRDSFNLTQGVVVVFRDVTKEHQLEEMKNEFISIASHELRTPMTAIKGMLSMILEGDYGQYPQNLKEPLQDISTSTNRLIDLVNDMLDVSRIEANRIKISLVSFDLSQVIKEVGESLKPIFIQKKLSFKLGRMDRVMVQSDMNKTRQILNNLLGNSLKFTNQGGLSIWYQIEKELVVVFVADTGIGIKPEDQQKLFGRFSQISSAESGKPAGTGLGLYISKHLCQIMGGDLWIEKSVRDQGSTFAFSLPIAGSSLAQNIFSQIERNTPLNF